ncbi:MAG: hypothetical protein IJI25_08770 [Eubacterium sp.]|nr:hypothetical protein [Eubacterium sp.]
MAYKEKKLNKADIQAMYNALGSMPGDKPKKGKKPGTVKRSASKRPTAKKK